MVHLIADGALIQSKYLVPNPNVPYVSVGNFEAVVFSGPLAFFEPVGSHQVRPRSIGTLQHYSGWWGYIGPISKRATGPGCIIQSSIGSRGNFEVVVPEPEGLAHYWRDNSSASLPWWRSATVAPGSTGPGSMVQNRQNDNLEVVVLHGQELRYYWRDASGWHPGGSITSNASGPASLIQSTYGGNLELVVPEGRNLVLYWRNESETLVKRWRFGGIVTNAATGSAGFIQGSYGRDPNRNFEVVVPEGDVLAHYWRDNTDGNLPWYPGGAVTRLAGPINAATIMQSSFGADNGDHFNATRDNGDYLEVLAQENGGSMYHYYRYWDGSRFQWYRAGCLRVDERVNEPDAPYEDRSRPMSSKIVQLTGQWDAQRKNRYAYLQMNTWGNSRAYNRTEEQCGIRGTDLGASFRHRGRIYFLFGDTHWTQDHPLREHGTLDSIAYTTTMDASQGLPLQFHCSFLQIVNPDIVNPPVSQGPFEVPLDGFSFAGEMFVFFTTSHRLHRKVMGRSVLARCLDTRLDFEASSVEQPLRFQCLTSVSELKFINVSVEHVGADAIEAYHLPGRSEGLLIWGTGAYRADNIYLAFLPLDDPRTRDNLLGSEFFPFSQLAVRYFSGTSGGVPSWSVREEDAVPLFYPAAIGELSVRWDAVLDRWVCMYMSGPEDPIGLAVILRVARKPWGPWSQRRLVLDWWMDGLGYRTDANQQRLWEGWFIHNGEATQNGEVTKLDDLGDDIIPNRTWPKAGGAYAPYQLPYHTKRSKDSAILYYVLSTWNPYQVVQMRHEISDPELAALNDRDTMFEGVVKEEFDNKSGVFDTKVEVDDKMTKIEVPVEPGEEVKHVGGYENPFGFDRSILEHILERLERLERHTGAGQPFIPRSERPDVGGDIVRRADENE